MADKSLNKDTTNLDNTIWDHKWGYADTKMFVHTDDMTVEMTGTRYNLCGYRMPYLIPFAREVLGAPIDFTDIRPMVAAPPVTPANINEPFLSAIKERLQPDQFALDDKIRLLHSHGQTTVDEVSRVLYHQIERCVDLVVYPVTQDDCVTIIQLAREHSVCLIPYGGGTNVSNALQVPTGETRMVVAVDMRRMNKIEWIDRTNMRASVQAGILGSTLEALLEKEGLTTGHEPDSVELSTLGGWISTNASGMKRNRYGNIEEVVEDITLVTPNGVVEECVPMPRVAMGTQVQKVLFGSEGNLGLITKAVIKIHNLPEAKKYDAYVFKDWKTGVAFMYALNQTGVVPASIRLVDNTQFRFSQALKAAPEGMGIAKDKIQNFVLKSVKGFDAHTMVAATIVFEGAASEVAYQEKVVSVIAKKHGGLSAGASNGERGYMLTYAIAYIRDLLADYYITGETYETTSPWSRIHEVCDAVTRTVEAEHKAYGFPGKAYASPRVTQMYHTGVCIYFTHGFYHKGVENAEEKFAAMEKKIRQAIMDAGGSISHHHGVGKLRKEFLSQTMTPTSEAMVRELKQAVDPENIFGARNNVMGEQSAMLLEGKLVLLTGASRGLGRALAQDLARAGSHLALTARDATALEETAALCRAAGAPVVHTFVADITQEDSCSRLVAQATVALGGLDMLVLNAGLSMWADFTQVRDLALYEQLLRTNYLSAVYLLHAALPQLRSRRGRIVTISSAQAWTGLPHHTGYAASKAALQAFLDSLAMELGNEVSMLGVYPGWIRGTELRAAALGADGQPLGDARRSHSSLSVTAEECSATVMRALRRDKRMVFVPRTLRILYALRPFAFPLIQRVLTGAAGSQAKTHP